MSTPPATLAIVAWAAVALPVAPAGAQVIFGPGMSGGPDRSIPGRATDDESIYTCQGVPGGSRIRENCESETATLRHEQEIKLSFKLNALPPPSAAQCGAATTTAYQQRDTIARVNSTFEITDCAAASGAFTVAVRVKDESGVEKPLEFSETWQRSDARDVTFTADYPIGDNVELLDVRLRAVTCTCADPAATETQPPATPE